MLGITELDLSHYRRDESGIKGRKLGVMFKDLRVVGTGASASFQPTFGSMFNPKIILENIKNARHPEVRDLLSGFEGVVRPGEMLRAWFRKTRILFLTQSQLFLDVLGLDAPRFSRLWLIGEKSTTPSKAR
jgi:hypothetical protein